MNKTNYDPKLLAQDLRKKLADVNLGKLSKEEINMVRIASPF